MPSKDPRLDNPQSRTEYDARSHKGHQGALFEPDSQAFQQFGGDQKQTESQQCMSQAGSLIPSSTPGAPEIPRWVQQSCTWLTAPRRALGVLQQTSPSLPCAIYRSVTARRKVCQRD